MTTFGGRDFTQQIKLNSGQQDGSQLNPASVLIKRDNLDTERDTRGTYTLRDNYVKRQQEDNHLQAKERP